MIRFLKTKSYIGSIRYSSLSIFVGYSLENKKYLVVVEDDAYYFIIT